MSAREIPDPESEQQGSEQQGPVVEDGVHPWDPGLQPERTALAWLRTSLSYAVASAGLARLMTGRHLGLAIAVVCLLLPLALLVAGFAEGRYRRVDRRLRAGRPLGSGLPHLLLVALATLFGIAACGYVLLG